MWIHKYLKNLCGLRGNIWNAKIYDYYWKYVHMDSLFDDLVNLLTYLLPDKEKYIKKTRMSWNEELTAILALAVIERC